VLKQPKLKEKKIMEDLAKKITERLEELRCHLQADGGDLEIVSIEGKLVKLKLRGACGCCPHATMTIKGGLERILRDEIDSEITIERV
jgi:Fe-S cluster biogenesis protein NfuA